MLRPLFATALAMVAVSLPAAAAGSPSAVLTGVVTASATISLKNADGTNVTHLDPGTYTVNVDDQSPLHNFHLFGPGVEMSTAIETTGPAVWEVTLTGGTYRFVCDVHPLTMKGTFTAGTPPPSPIVPKLNGRITGRLISLKTASGARVRSLRQNTYKIAVSDTSKRQNFHLTGPGINRKTRVAATARATWTVSLSPGRYVYRSDKRKKLRGTFTVTPVPPPG